MKKFNPKRYDLKPLEGGIMCDVCPLRKRQDSFKCNFYLRRIAVLRGVKDREDGPSGLLCDHFEIVKLRPKWLTILMRLFVAAALWLVLFYRPDQLTDIGRASILAILVAGFVSAAALAVKWIKK